MTKIEFSQIKGVDKIGKGGQAKVFKAPAGSIHVQNAQIHEAMAIKKYSDKTLQGKESAIEQYLKMLIEQRENALDNFRESIDKYTIWPRFLVYENSKVCGFAMRLIPDKFFACYKGITGEKKNELSTFDFILNDDKSRSVLGLPIINNIGRQKIVRDILYIVSSFHENSFIIGDLSPNNILVYVDAYDQTKNRVLFIDTDSFRKANHTHPLKQPHTPNWYPPESWTARQQRINLERSNGDKNLIMRNKITEFIQNTQTDIYKVCLAILRLYHDGIQRTAISESTIAFEKIAKEINRNFAVLIEKGLNATPSIRPSAQDLYKCLCFAISKK